jgi:hypothetical protein
MPGAGPFPFLPQRIGDVAFKPLPNGKVAFLAPPGYANLLRLFGGVQRQPGSRWVLSQERAASLIERLRQYAPRPSNRE